MHILLQRAMRIWYANTARPNHYLFIEKHQITYLPIKKKKKRYALNTNQKKIISCNALEKGFCHNTYQFVHTLDRTIPTNTRRPFSLVLALDTSFSTTPHLPLFLTQLMVSLEMLNLSFYLVSNKPLFKNKTSYSSDELAQLPNIVTNACYEQPSKHMKRLKTYGTLALFSLAIGFCIPLGHIWHQNKITLQREHITADIQQMKSHLSSLPQAPSGTHAFPFHILFDYFAQHMPADTILQELTFRSNKTSSTLGVLTLSTSNSTKTLNKMLPDTLGNIALQWGPPTHVSAPPSIPPLTARRVAATISF